MNSATVIDRLPSASDFVSAMWDRVQDAYPRVMPVVATAIVQAGGDRDAIVRMAGNKANRAAFLMGCCAEELVSSGFTLKGRQAKQYVGDVVATLRPLAWPIRSRRVAPDFRRLLAAYEQEPVRMRVKTIQHMLAVNGLENELAIVSKNEACQLQIECSVTMDGITGCLIELMKPEGFAEAEGNEATAVNKDLGPVITRSLQKLP